MLLKKRLNRAIVLLHDLLAITAAWLLAYWLRFNLGVVPTVFMSKALIALALIFPIQIAAYWSFGLYRGIWRFASLPDLVRIIKAVLAGTAASALVLFFYSRMEGVPRSIFPLYCLLLITFLGGARLLYRWFSSNIRGFSAAQRVLIVGAGQAGEGVVRDLLRDISKKYKPVAFIDDDKRKHGQEIHGVRVRGLLKDIPAIIKQWRIDLIIIAIPSATSATMRRIVSYCEDANKPFRTLPGIKDLASGKVSINALRKVSIEDLLGREPVTLDWQGINRELKGKVVIVSGGGGSIGAELCRQVAQLEPAKLIIYEQNEFNLYTVTLELQQKFPQLALYGQLGDVADSVAVQKVFATFNPQIVFHAAAYKHVPLLQTQLRTAIRNNVIGTRVFAEAAVAHHAQKFILISTDKAVNPTNIMGTTKRIAEIFCQNLNASSNTKFITVRFGNVLDSAGSVVPLFRQQIATGGPITVTHPEITRFFMTIPEAAQLILQATVMGQGGEIFVLDMGEPIKIRYLAEQMIKLSGLKLDEDIEIKYTGLRPGEKLFEELFHENEQLVSTLHHKILRAQHRAWEWKELVAIMDELVEACAVFDEGKLQYCLLKMVPEYKNEPGLNSTLENANNRLYVLPNKH